MKAKSIFQCAALLTGLLLFNDPLFATVESDIVGYTEVTIKPGYNLLSLPFNDLTNGQVDVKALFSGTPTNLDQIQYWNGTKLQTIVYNVAKGGWCKGLNLLADGAVMLSPGQGFWYYSKAAGDNTLTVSGRVETSATGQTVNAGPGYTLVGPAVPKSFALSDISFKVGDIDGAPNLSQVQYWNGTKLQTLVYNVAKGGWCKGLTPLTDETMKTFVPAEGFWFYNKTSDSVTITFPLSVTE